MFACVCVCNLPCVRVCIICTVVCIHACSLHACVVCVCGEEVCVLVCAVGVIKKLYSVLF